MQMTPEQQYKERKQWFDDRIGKRVYRNGTTCTCASCESVRTGGLIIFDKMHADYLCDVEGCSNEDPTQAIRYFDTLEEAIDFEKNKNTNAN